MGDLHYTVPSIVMLHDGCMVPGGVETEVKIRIPDRARVLEQLRTAGFQVSVPRLFEANTLYDKPDQSLQSANMLLRLRQAGDHGVVTWKGPGQGGTHKTRAELETTLGSVDAMEQIFQHLGLERSFRYEKYRTEYRKPADTAGVVTLDETPIGDFVEIEGPGEWIDQTAARLGFAQSDYVLDSYGRLYLSDCERRGVTPSNMVFEPRE